MRHVSKVGKRVGSVGSVCRGLNILLHTSDQVIGCNVTGLHCSLKAVSFLHIGWGLITKILLTRVQVI